MTLEERLAIISQKAKNDKAEKFQKEQEENAKLSCALSEIKLLATRIQDIITIANKCIEENIPFPSNTKKFGYGDGGYNFLTDGIRHHVGFIGIRCHNGQPNQEVKYLGIKNGGCCGPYDFYTNGHVTFMQHEKESHDIKAPTTIDIKDFMSEFDAFETAFYKWIDSMADECGEGTESESFEQLLNETESELRHCIDTKINDAMGAYLNLLSTKSNVSFTGDISPEQEMTRDYIVNATADLFKQIARQNEIKK